MHDLHDSVAAIMRECSETIILQHFQNLSADQIGQIVFVGGSSLMAVIEDTMVRLFPHATLERTEAFTAVAAGLAIAASKLRW